MLVDYLAMQVLYVEVFPGGISCPQEVLSSHRSILPVCIAVWILKGRGRLLSVDVGLLLKRVDRRRRHLILQTQNALLIV